MGSPLSLLQNRFVPIRAAPAQKPDVVNLLSLGVWPLIIGKLQPADLSSFARTCRTFYHMSRNLSVFNLNCNRGMLCQDIGNDMIVTGHINGHIRLWDLRGGLAYVFLKISDSRIIDVKFARNIIISLNDNNEIIICRFGYDQANKIEMNVERSFSYSDAKLMSLAAGIAMQQSDATPVLVMCGVTQNKQMIVYDHNTATGEYREIARGVLVKQTYQYTSADGKSSTLKVNAFDRSHNYLLGIFSWGCRYFSENEYEKICLPSQGKYAICRNFMGYSFCADIKPAEKGVYILDLETLQHEKIGPPKFLLRNICCCASLNKIVAIGCKNGFVYLYDIAQNRRMVLPARQASVLALRFDIMPGGGCKLTVFYQGGIIRICPI